MLSRSDHDEPSVFLPENLLREARRQRGLPAGRVPDVCVLDPDGDIVRHLRDHHGAAREPSWACYHTDLWTARLAGVEIGLVGGAVGAPFAVLVAEELRVSGCRLLLSITSAGRIADHLPSAGMVLIERALRGEGTSAAYLPPAPDVAIAAGLRERVAARLATLPGAVPPATSWTTDAPFRETATALAAARGAGADIVEMEAAALYAFGHAQGMAVACFAQVTNGMAVTEHDFEKGAANGAEAAWALIGAVAGAAVEPPQPASRRTGAGGAGR